MFLQILVFTEVYFFVLVGHIHIQVNNIIQRKYMKMSLYFCSISYECDGCNKTERCERSEAAFVLDDF